MYLLQYPVPTKPDTQGATDRTIAKWLSTKKFERSKIILATKVSGQSERINWLPNRPNGCRVSYQDIISSVDASLARLQTDYIDLLQIHWPDRYVPLFGDTAYDLSKERDYIPFEEQLRAFEYLHKEGKVRCFGVSNETPYGVMKFSQLATLGGFPAIVSIQNSYSLINRADFESSLTEVCSPRHENIGLLAYSPLAGGILTGKYANSDCPGARLNLFQGYMERYKQSLAQEAVKEYSNLAQQYELTPAQLALIWCYSQPHVASTIIGATTLSQLNENIEAYDMLDKYTDEIREGISKIYKRYRDPSKI